MRRANEARARGEWTELTTAASGWLEADARAKVNLRLQIFPPRADGFHPLETLFCRVSLADRLRLRLRSQPGVSIRVTGSEPAPANGENLAARAADLFLKHAQVGGGVEIELEKRVPPGSGLGGGSSDAAAVLRTLSGAAEKPLDPSGLIQLGAQLGSDVPFFVADAPLAWARGRGEQLAPIPSLPPRPLLLVLPDISIATADAYSLWDEKWREADAPSAELVGSEFATIESWESVVALASNDFEPVIFARHPSLAGFKERLEETKPLLSMLSGSGSALFAVYESEGKRDQASAGLRAEMRGARLVSAVGPV